MLNKEQKRLILEHLLVWDNGLLDFGPKDEILNYIESLKHEEYLVFDGSGKLVQEGSEVSEVRVPRHGSVSILVNGSWLNVLTTEGVIVSMSEEPINWAAIY